MKNLSDLQRNVDVARGRGISLAQVIRHDLLSTNILFNGNHTSKPNDKSVLVPELEKHFGSLELNFENNSDLLNCFARRFYVNDSANVTR